MKNTKVKDKVFNALDVRKLRLIEKNKIAKNTVTFKFEIPEGYSYTPGTHFHLATPDFMAGGKPDKKKVRSFSVMSLQEEGYLGLTTRVVEEPSIYKKQLMTLEPTDNLLMFKTGNRMMLKREERPLVFISMGVGIATFRPLIISYENNSQGISEVININVDSSMDYLYRDEIEAIKVEGFTNHFLPSRKAIYTTIDNVLEGGNSGSGPIFYLVGSDDFLGCMYEYLTKKSVDGGDIVIDKSEKARNELIGNMN